MSRKVMQRNYDDKGNLISKECSCCHKIKPVSEFYKDKIRIDGLQLECKECRKKYYQGKERKQIKRNYDNEGNLISKECCCCYEIKPVSEFYKNKTRIDGFNTNCKECAKKYYQENPDYFKKYNKEYRQENKDKVNEKQRKYITKKTQKTLQQIKTEIESNPEKYNYIDGKEPYGVIYLVHNIKSDKYYVGQTTVGFDNRYPLGWLYRHGYKNAVKHDLELYGENSFEYIKIFDVAYSQYELDKKEVKWIDHYNSYKNGYNERRGNLFTDRGKEK